MRTNSETSSLSQQPVQPSWKESKDSSMVHKIRIRPLADLIEDRMKKMWRVRA